MLTPTRVVESRRAAVAHVKQLQLVLASVLAVRPASPRGDPSARLAPLSAQCPAAEPASSGDPVWQHSRQTSRSPNCVHYVQIRGRSGRIGRIGRI
jgi:hypothetical protein